MTRKDFELVAREFADELHALQMDADAFQSRNDFDRADNRAHKKGGVWLAVYAFCRAAERINPGFDRVRFIARVEEVYSEMLMES